jgi:hypothetical protein
LQVIKNVRIASFLAMTYDNKSKEIYELIQGHGWLGCNKGAEDSGGAVEGVRGKPQLDIIVEAGGDPSTLLRDLKEHGEGIRR